MLCLFPKEDLLAIGVDQNYTSHESASKGKEKKQKQIPSCEGDIKCVVLAILWRITLEHKYEVHTISFQTFFIWALLLIVHT